MSYPYRSVDMHTWSEWDGRQEALRERLERMRRFVPPAVREQPESRPVHVPPPEDLHIEIGHRPTFDGISQAKVRLDCRIRGAIRGADGEMHPQRVWDSIRMRGDSVQVGRVLMAACEAYLEEIEKREESAA